MRTEDGNVHQMTLMNEHEGTEEWQCSICGRHLLVNWKPQFKRTVLEAGDLSVSHGGFKGGPQMGEMMIASLNEAPLQQEIELPTEDSRLDTWAAWLDKIGFDDLWKRDDQ